MGRSEADRSAGLIKEEYETQAGRTEAPTARSPVAGTVELVKPLHRHPTNHAYLDRLTVPSDSIVWRPRRRPRTEARARRRDDHSGRLDITGPITEGRVLIKSRLVQRPGSIRFGPLCGLKSDISRGPRSAISGREQSQQNPLYSITSSASESRLSEILMPSASAVLRLITVSNLVGCSTGRSAGFAPLRIFAV